MNINLTVTWKRAAKIKTFILGFSYNSFENVVQVLPTFFDWLRRLDLSLSNSVAAYKRYFFQNMASENSQKTLGVINATLRVTTVTPLHRTFERLRSWRLSNKYFSLLIHIFIDF